ncbi:NUDIX domain-containing protein [Anaplasmataceae bacterium AB001_6]|nr:NUDIX domain-containing protein [Anaplasmataceae bacterium AB001_6]
MNPGETAENAVICEVKEEVELEIKNIRYFGTQSWPFIMVFRADYSSGEIKLQKKELKDAK